MIPALLALAASAAPSVSFQEAISGVYEARVSEAEHQARTEAAIERAVSSLPWAFRPFARPSLRRATGLCERLRLRLTATRFSGACLSPADEGFSFPLGEDIPAYVEDGETYHVHLHLEDGAWVSIRHEGPRGGLARRWRLCGAGGLELEERVFSSQLPEDMVWTVPYGRVP